MDSTSKHPTDFLVLDATATTSNESVTNTTDAPYQRYDFHPGFTTLIGCCIISIMLLLYLSTEPALAYLRRNTSGMSRTSAQSTIASDKPPPPVRQNLYVKDGEMIKSTAGKITEYKLSKKLEECRCSLTERYPQSIKSQEDAHEVEIGGEHDGDSIESVTRSSTIVLLSTNPTKATGIDLRNQSYCLESQSVV